MPTPIIMLVLMTLPYIAVRGTAFIRGRPVDGRRPAALGLALLFLFTGVGHFVKTGAMIEMLPPWVPGRLALVYATGILEFAIAAGFVLPRTRRLAGWMAAVALLAFLPVNVYAAIHHIPMGGHAWGPVYLLLRIPLQAVVLWWTYWFTIRRPGKAFRRRAPRQRTNKISTR